MKGSNAKGKEGEGGRELHRGEGGKNSGCELIDALVALLSPLFERMNLLNPNIVRHILHTVLYTILMMLSRRVNIFA